MSVVRKASYLFMAYVCAVILAYLIPEQIDRRDYARAVVAYTQNPTQGNEAALQAERRVNDRIHLRDSAAFGLVLVTLGYGIWSGRRLMTRLKHRTGPGDLRQ
jgi:ferric-dicitrate binding protein FerR (iron transport regulator)